MSFTSAPTYWAACRCSDPNPSQEPTEQDPLVGRPVPHGALPQCHGAGALWLGNTSARLTAGALESGDITRDEMMEVVVHLAHYAGWPKAAAMYRQLLKLCADLGSERGGA